MQENTKLMMSDAREEHAAALRLLDAGDWREAAGKGRQAVYKASFALILALDVITDAAGREELERIGPQARIRRLARRIGGDYVGLRQSYAYFAHSLRGEAYDDGKAYIIPDIPDLLREVDDYLRKVEEWAEQGRAGLRQRYALAFMRGDLALGIRDEVQL